MTKRFIALFITCITIISITLVTYAIPTFSTYENRSSEITPSGIPIENLEETIDNYVSNYIGETTPGAAIAVIKDGNIIFSKGYGFADIENQIKVDPKNTIFEWGSISKLFTWTSVMQLVEEGKIDLDEDIKVYLPDDFYKKLNLNQTISMRDIMNHSAGFGDYAFNTIAFSPEDLVSLEEAILRDKPKQYYEVGTASAYSNYATSIAGYIVEHVSANKFEEYEENFIFNKLDMNRTSAYSDLADKKILINAKANGYISDQNGGFLLSNWSYISHRPAGSINGTVEDLARYAMALTPSETELSPLFKSDNTLDIMLSPSYDISGDFVGTNHGFFDYISEYKTYGHGGNTASFSSQFAVVPEERFGLVILTNAKYEMDILFGLHDLLLTKKDPSLDTTNTDLPASDLVVGSYVPMQRQEGNFLDFIKYISLYNITATDQNEITLNLGSYKAIYKQTKPFYYELIKDNAAIFKVAYPTLKFKMDGDTVEQVIVGHGMDLSALKKSRTMPILIWDTFILISSALFFSITSFVLLIIRIKNRKIEKNIENKRFSNYHLALLILGILTIVNNIIPSAMIMIDNFKSFDEVSIYIMINYPLLLASIVLSVLSFRSIKRALLSRKTKILYLITIIMLVSIFELLITWNFFAL